MTDEKDPTPTPENTPANSLTRRKFLRSGAATGSALYLVTSKNALSQLRSDHINVAAIGCGAQGEAIRESILPDANDIGLNFVAVCDIWDFKRKGFANSLRRKGYEIEEHVDIQEMLDKRKDLDVVFIATPDFVHAPHSIAALNADNIKGVYCEKMMSNSIEGARSMVQAQKDTGKLFQIGHQRRSNPRYIHTRNNLIHGNEICGRVTHAFGQWCRGVSDPIKPNPKVAPPEDVLKKYGYSNFLEFSNWRWFKKYGGGPISDLGAHQIDIFNWMFDSLPTAVVASGGKDYYEDYEFEDNMLCIYEYDLPQGKTRAMYQVLTTNGNMGFYEKFMGEDGSIVISEVPKVNQAYRESNSTLDWKTLLETEPPMLKKSQEVYHKIWEHPRPWGGVTKSKDDRWLASAGGGDAVLDARVAASAAVDEWELPVSLDRRPHNPHIKNFVETVRDGGAQEDLNCPVYEAFKTCVTVLKLREAVANGGRYEFTKEDFMV